jgi:hypothetical protein
MGRPLKIAKGSTIDIGIPGQTETGNIGVVGGENPTGNTILVQANIEYAPGQFARGDSFIVRQKGIYKYLVANVATPTRQNICFVVNTANTLALTAGQMNIVSKNAANANVILAVITNENAVAFADQGNILNSPTLSGNFTLGNAFFPSFVAANATLQPGSATPPGLYPIVLVPSF